eukprot:8649744-Ditylum_brightwellii.AAC.1
MDPLKDPSDDLDGDSNSDDSGEFEAYIAINEMMIRFFGYSHFKHRVKNKSDKEMYKWFVMAGSKTSYVYNITPDGRRAGTNGQEADEVVVEEEHGK